MQLDRSQVSLAPVSLVLVSSIGAVSPWYSSFNRAEGCHLHPLSPVSSPYSLDMTDWSLTRPLFPTSVGVICCSTSSLLSYLEWLTCTSFDTSAPAHLPSFQEILRYGACARCSGIFQLITHSGLTCGILPFLPSHFSLFSREDGSCLSLGDLAPCSLERLLQCFISISPGSWDTRDWLSVPAYSSSVSRCAPPRCQFSCCFP